jgi:Tol biopolymer transport system component
VVAALAAGATMSVTAPPQPAELRDLPEALIEEARQRARRRRLRNAVAALAALLGALSLYAVIAGGAGTPTVGSGADAPAATSRDALPEELSYSYGAVWIVRRDGGQHRLTNDTFGAAWSADGKRLLALQDESLVIVHLDGRVDHVADGANGFVTPSLSPDGTTVAFHRVRGQGSGLYVVGTDGEQARRVARANPGLHRYSSVSWSPDGRRLAYGTMWGLYIARADGRGDPVRIPTDVSPGREPYPPGFGGAAWSPDGSLIAFDFGGSVFVVRPDGVGLRLLAGGTDPVWSPDGTKIAFHHDGFDGAVVEADGTGFRRLPACRCDLRGPVFNPSLSWSSDGSRIAFVSGRGNAVSTVRPDGTGLSRVALRPARRYEGPWRPLWRPARENG